MTAQERMAAVLKDNPTYGREKLARAAQTSGPTAQRFLKKWKKEQGQPKELPPAQSKEARLVIENNHLRQQVHTQQEQLTKLLAATDLINDISKAQLEPPKWLITPSGKTNRAIATAILTDTHFDEVVNPSEIGGVNAYNRDIAQKRLRRFFTNTVKLGRDVFSGIQMEGLVMPMLGDIVSGTIHEELAQTNAASILDTCLFWSEEIAAGMEHLLAFYGQIFAPCVVGNHGRQTRKPRNKGRVRDNFDYLIYSLVARHYRNNERVTFLIPDTSDAHFQIYSTKFCATHGDQFRGGTGIAGALSPLMLGDARKRKRSNATNRPYDYLMMGHFHQAIDAMGIICCNAMKGYDEYAANCNFAYSDPTQTFFLTDPDKGRTVCAPIHVLDAGEEWDFEPNLAPSWLAA
jgi:hypothetical protein